MCRRSSVILRRISSSVMDALWPGKHHLSDQTSATTRRGSHRHRSSLSSSTTTNVNGREEDLIATLAGGDGSNTTNRPFKINLSAKFIVAMYALSVIIPFSAAYFFGPLLVFCFHSINFVRDVELSSITPLSSSKTHAHQVLVAEMKAASNGDVLPVPTIQEGKIVPLTLYTSKMFPSYGSATSTSVQLDRSRSHSHSHSHSHSTAAIKAETINDESSDEEEINDSDELHLPAGQHLLVDIKNVESSFLNSEKKLATAMVDLITESKLTLLSYHCHSLIPIGVSCVGVLLESHMAFHTWPSEGVISMDLFTCGSGRLIPILPLIKQLFGVKAAGEEADEPAMLWSHKLRGFRDGFIPGYASARNPLDSDLGRFIIGSHANDVVKTPILSAQTEFQAVDVYEVMDETRNIDDYQKSLEDEEESLHPEFFGPDKVLLLDGVIQSTRYGDAPYHESIVHPALITHPNPKRVAIVGGGEGATLREVLKHSSVEQAVMIEIDEGVVDLSRDYLPEWQDCSSIAHHAHKGSAPWCFDDKRADVRFEDAMAYFIDNFGPYKGDEDDESKFDVVVMDCLDPNDDIPFAKLLYTSDDYLNSLYSSLTEEGILVVQVGEAPDVNDPADETGEFANRQEMIDMLSGVGFKSIHLYQESHCGFGAPWTTLVAFKDIATRKRWYRSSAEIEFNLSHRILPTKDGKSSLRYFDGATMMSYQIPEKTFEDVYCRQQTKPHDCREDSIQGQGRLSSAFNSSSASAYNPVFERHTNHQVPIQSMIVAGNDQNELKSTSNQASGASEGANANALKAPLKWSDGVAPGLDMSMDLYEIIYSEESPIQSVQILDTYFGKTLVTGGKTQSSAHAHSYLQVSAVEDGGGGT